MKELKKRAIVNNVVFCAESASSARCDGTNCAMRTLAKVQADSPEFVRFQVLHSRKVRTCSTTFWNEILLFSFLNFLNFISFILFISNRGALLSWSKMMPTA